jgi:hypothetical protein
MPAQLASRIPRACVWTSISANHAKDAFIGFLIHATADL